MKLNPELRQELMDVFYHASVDDMHMAEASRRFLQDYTQVVDLMELVSFLEADLSDWLDVPKKLMHILNRHPRVDVSLGDALHATQYRLLRPELELACSPSVGVRLLTAIASKDADVLALTSVDPCCLVRFASYENANSPKKQIERLLKDDIFFRELSSQDIYRIGDDQEELATVESCGCTAEGISDFIHDKYSDKLLEIPPIANEFGLRMRSFGGFDFGTQPLPSPIEDYLFLDILNYLKGPIPDQYVLNHAGHGVNSYSLNFRYALGDLAVLMQVGFGGGYMNQEKSAKRWNDCVNQIGDVMLLNPDNRKEGLRQRKYLLLYSSFRSEIGLRLLVLRDNIWTELPLVKSWDDVHEFFSFWGSPDTDPSSIAPK